VRIVSLVPSATETLLAWGVTPVGVTRWCEHPELPQMGGTKDPDLGRVRAAQPDLVVLCDEENRLEDAESLERAGVATHTIAIRSVADVPPALRALAERIGVRPTIEESCSPRPALRRAFVPIWRQAARGRAAEYLTLNDDTYGASVLAAIGIANCFGATPTRYPATTLEEAAALRPDLVVAPSEPYPFGPRHVAELSSVAPVVLVDGQDLFWWGVRTPAAVERLRAGLSPAAPKAGRSAGRRTAARRSGRGG
jgi:ABC-type Fe3+-hydroxamate transport system substrate-binding protein